MQATWKPHEKHGQLTAKADLPDSVFAFPSQRKEPLTDAKHVRNAIARFDQVMDVSDDDRALAFANIKKAAEHYDVELTETSWRDLGVHCNPIARKRRPKPSRPNASAERSNRPAAAKGDAQARTRRVEVVDAASGREATVARRAPQALSFL